MVNVLMGLQRVNALIRLYSECLDETAVTALVKLQRMNALMRLQRAYTMMRPHSECPYETAKSECPDKTA